MSEAQHYLQKNGFHMLSEAISQFDVATLIENTALLASGSPHGVRNLLRKSSFIEKFFQSEAIRKIIEPIAGKTAFPVRAIYFDKIPEANWNVAWHQDTKITVKEKKEVKGYCSWSSKEGVVHVEPPKEILENILTLRVHLDSTGENNGALRVLSGSHSNGRVKSNEVIQLVNTGIPITCTAEPGDILLMRPLLFHSSRKSLTPSHRRIIHVEYCSSELPKQLEWHERIS
jgi:ectoine hydroxylase-related dioxygenase (phytanoyl-CoA dioxygenase family)